MMANSIANFKVYNEEMTEYLLTEIGKVLKALKTDKVDMY